MTAIVKAKRPAEFLVALPRMLGYAPVESIVVQTFQNRRTAATLRVDLPPAATGTQAVADALIRLISRVPAVDAVLIAVYTKEPWSGPLPPRPQLVESIVTRMASGGLGIIDALCCSTEHWASYLDDENGSVGELLDSRLGCELDGVIGDGFGQTLDRQGAPPILTGHPEERRDVAVAAGELTHDKKERVRLWQWANAGPLWSDAIETTPTDLPGPAVAALLWSIRDKGVRDCALMQLAWGGDAGRSAALDTEQLRSGGALRAGSILQTFVGEGRSAPGGLRLEGAIRLLRHLVALSPQPWIPAPLTLLAWCEWSRGHGSAAGDYLDLALSAAPGYELARLFHSLIASGSLPEWVGRAPQ